MASITKLPSGAYRVQDNPAHGRGAHDRHETRDHRERRGRGGSQSGDTGEADPRLETCPESRVE
jgi:hypothetical protein